MLYTVKCPKCGAEQKGLDLAETEGTFICSECKTKVNVYKEELKDSITDEKWLYLLNGFLEDDTRWDLMTDRELERRLRVYEHTGEGEDFVKAMSCLRLASVYYLKTDKEGNSIMISSTDKGDYLPVYSSKRKISKEDKQKYYVQEVRFTDLCKFFEKAEKLVGIILNSNTNKIVIGIKELLSLMQVIDHVTELFDKMLDDGVEGAALTEIMFERYGGRKVKIELKDGNIIEGEVMSSHIDEGEVFLDVTVCEEEIPVYRKDVKTIKSLPFDL